MKQILHLVPLPKFYYLFFDTGLLFPRIRATRATFKAVLMAADMTKAVQTRCKTLPLYIVSQPMHTCPLYSFVHRTFLVSRGSDASVLLHPVHQVDLVDPPSDEKIQICGAILRSHAATRAFQEGSIVTNYGFKDLSRQQHLSLSSVGTNPTFSGR